jgi:hypothetical protein
MNAARNMGREIAEAEASAITEEASITRKHLSADNLAKFLGVTFEQRQRLGLTTIGSVNVKKRARKELRKRQNRIAHERRRRGLGMRPRTEYEANSMSKAQPWRKMGMSRATWYRQRQNKAATRIETSVSAPIFLSSEDRPVSPAGEIGLAERGFASKKVRRLPSSQTATTLAADVYEPLPIELRLLALQLPFLTNLAQILGSPHENSRET